jgi:predicted nucleic acid-binding protein
LADLHAGQEKTEKSSRKQLVINGLRLNLLLGLWRNQPWAVSFARRHSAKSLGIPWVVLGEFWHGAICAGHDSARAEGFLVIGVPILDAGAAVESYARICTQLQDMGHFRDIGQNDLWIVAVAMSHNLPLVTRTQRHFREIKGLKLELIA